MKSLSVLLALVVCSPIGAGALFIRKAELSSPEDNSTNSENQYQGPDWGILDPEGGSSKTEDWVAEPAGALAYFFAALFVVLIGSMPVVLAYADEHPLASMTKTAMVESAILYVWLVGGLFLFTNVLYFQSPHFGGKIRSLTLIEAVYLFSQIITTVGYGDITPAKARGQVFVGIFVVISFVLIAGMAAQLADIITQSLKDKLGLTDATPRDAPEVKNHNWVALKPVLQSLCVFVCFVIIGTLFFSQYPGEQKTIGQGIYMSLITLSSVGFGAFTPVTQAGMVFGAFWMLFGVSSLGALVASFTAYVSAMKAWERAHQEQDVKACDES